MSNVPAHKALRRACTIIVAKPRKPTSSDPYSYSLLFVKRSMKSSFMKGAMVFPGGVVDPSDSFDNWKQLFPASTYKVTVPTFADRMCAIRELFEESGLLLANKMASNDISIPNSELCPESAKQRALVHYDASKFKEICKDFLHVRPSINALKSFSHWTTPKQEKRRFNTHFFFVSLDKAPAEDDLMADGGETTKLVWMSPQAALTQFNEKLISLPPPTFYSLQQLMPYYSATDAINCALHDERPIEHIMPVILPQENGWACVLPGDAEHDDVVLPDELSPNSVVLPPANNSDARRRLVVELSDAGASTYRWECTDAFLRTFPLTMKPNSKL